MASFRLSLAVSLLGLVAPVFADPPSHLVLAGTIATDGAKFPLYANRTSQEIRQFDDLRRFARSKATEMHEPEPPLTPELAKLDYERYREITFRHDQGVWTNSGRPFWLEFFHRGFVQRDRVDVFTVGRKVEQVIYNKNMFHYGNAADPETIPSEVGFAGFKVAGRFTPDGDPQELLSFIGSSYFRARSGDTVYGSSARGLAIDIGMPTKEQFPDFRQFWVIDPDPSDKTITVLAFLDSPSLTGAYEFILNPGASVSTVDVRCELHVRQHETAPEIRKLAIAPLTSMWMWGDGLDGPPRDLRPSVHDCDGLLVHADGRPTWRAIARLPYPSVSRLDVTALEGFGLIQRQRAFDKYRDTNARYHERPSVWVCPGDQWPAGTLELIELPGAHEGIDNIGAYWVSDRLPTKGHPLRLSYQLRFGGDIAISPNQPPNDESLSELDGESLGIGEEFQIAWMDKQIELTISFVWKQIPPDRAPELPELAVDIIRADAMGREIVPCKDGYRVTITLRPTETVPPELSLTLQDKDGKPITETFAYLCPLEEPQFVYPDVYTRIESGGLGF